MASFSSIDLPIAIEIASVLLLVLAATGAAFLGYRVGCRRTRSSSEVSSEEDLRELRKSAWFLQNENKNLSKFMTLLPEFARELSENRDKRRIAPLLRRMIDQIFDPQQIVVFYTNLNGDSLVLVEQKGVEKGWERSKPLAFGEGRIGWVASQQISMDESDFQNKSRVVKADLSPDADGRFKVELAAPMAQDDRTLGVLAVGGMLRHPKNEKKMLRMIADLGSIALNNVFLFHQLQATANNDGLTGLFTKRHFLNQLAEELMKAEKRNEEFSVFIFDIDHFKNYNDTNGHLAGDECLKLTGKILRQSLREEDLPARYGGEEFIVLLPNTPKQGAAVVAEKIRASISEHVYPKEKSQPLGDLTISGGVACFPYDGRSSAELISAADEALYQAKRTGRNRVMAYEPTYLSEGAQVPEEADLDKVEA
ncbi:MAG TPA: sensor domain-containing diguanylate cyclase [Candidatus Saccharimonadales bacterium]|nr:sensor domain-containing diguanylate cyclase [Candidatus Saccharimonadales bacterium]